MAFICDMYNIHKREYFVIKIYFVLTGEDSQPLIMPMNFARLKQVNGHLGLLLKGLSILRQGDTQKHSNVSIKL